METFLDIADRELALILGLRTNDPGHDLPWTQVDDQLITAPDCVMNTIGYVDFHMGLETPGEPVYRIVAADTPAGTVRFSLIYLREGETDLPSWRADSVFIADRGYAKQYSRMAQLRVLSPHAPRRVRVKIALCQVLPGITANATPPYPGLRHAHRDTNGPWALIGSSRS